MLNITILIVEKSSYLFERFNSDTRFNGWRITTVNEPNAGLSHILDAMPDLILVDMELPDDGAQLLCAQIKLLMHVPIILLSTSFTDEDVLKGFRIGADDVIPMGCSSDLLEARLFAMLRTG